LVNENHFERAMSLQNGSHLPTTHCGFCYATQWRPQLWKRSIGTTRKSRRKLHWSTCCVGSCAENLKINHWADSIANIETLQQQTNYPTLKGQYLPRLSQHHISLFSFITLFRNIALKIVDSQRCRKLLSVQFFSSSFLRNIKLHF
jgi:hypothetical protein